MQPSRPKRPTAAIVGDSHAQVLGPVLKSLFEEGGWFEVSFVDAKPGRSLRAAVQDSNLINRLDGVGNLVVILGGNDRVTDEQAYASDVANFLAAVQAQGVNRVVWVGPMPTTLPDTEVDQRHQQVRELQDILLNTLQDEGVSWVDAYPLVRPSQLGPDGVHLTREGYGSLAERLVLSEPVVQMAQAATPPIMVPETRVVFGKRPTKQASMGGDSGLGQALTAVGLLGILGFIGYQAMNETA